MVDLLKEIQEDIRRERLRHLWDRFGVYLIAAALLVIIATGGYRLWQYWDGRQLDASAKLFISAIEPDNPNSAVELQKLSATGYRNYPVLASFRQASEMVKNGNIKKALAIYDRLAANPDLDDLLRNVARVHSATLLLDSADLSELKKRLEPVISSPDPIRFTATELMGFVYYNNGDNQEARKWFQLNVDSQEAPVGIAQRSADMVSLLDSEGSSTNNITKQKGDG